jgi:hypothetical protein
MRSLAALLLILLPLRLPALQLGLDAGVAVQASGPFKSAVAPGAAVSALWGLGPAWQGGLAFQQHTFFEADYYVTARALDLRLRRQNDGRGPWMGVGLGYNPMAWHYSNWRGWGHAAVEGGWTWEPSPRLGWDLNLGLHAWGPVEAPLWLATLAVGPRWRF